MEPFSQKGLGGTVNLMSSKGSITLNSVLLDGIDTNKWVVLDYDKDIFKAKEDYSEEFIKGIRDSILKWQKHEDVPEPFTHKSAPSDILTNKQKEYVFTHMKNELDTVTRVEEKGISVPEGELYEGNTIQFNKELKAFSKSEEATIEYLKGSFMPNNEFVIFKVKNPSTFDANSWTREYEAEEEVWLNGRKQYKITNITNKSYPQVTGIDKEQLQKRGINVDDFKVKYVEMEPTN